MKTEYKLVLETRIARLLEEVLTTTLNRMKAHQNPGDVVELFYNLMRECKNVHAQVQVLKLTNTLHRAIHSRRVAWNTDTDELVLICTELLKEMNEVAKRPH